MQQNKEQWQHNRIHTAKCCLILVACCNILLYESDSAAILLLILLHETDSAARLLLILLYEANSAGPALHPIRWSRLCSHSVPYSLIWNRFWCWPIRQQGLAVYRSARSIQLRCNVSCFVLLANFSAKSIHIALIKKRTMQQGQGRASTAVLSLTNQLCNKGRARDQPHKTAYFYSTSSQALSSSFCV